MNKPIPFVPRYTWIVFERLSFEFAPYDDTELRELAHHLLDYGGTEDEELLLVTSLVEMSPGQCERIGDYKLVKVQDY
jgi:hypothetical protein